MSEILSAIESDDAVARDFEALPVPESYRAVVVEESDADMFAGLPTWEKDPRRSLKIREVATPDLAPGEALVAVMASAINYNTVWTSIFEPVTTFGFLSRLGGKHHLPYHVVGSDLAGVVLRVGPGVTVWKPGDRVVAHCLDGHWNVQTATTTRSWTRSSGSGASRRTSAAWPIWRWSRRTS